MTDPDPVENSNAEVSPTANLPIQRKLPDAVLEIHKGLGPPVGIFSNVDEEQYHASPGFSSTDVKQILRSPAHYRANKSQEFDSSTYAKAFGSALHTGVLEPWLFDTKVVRGLDKQKRSNADKAAWSEFNATHKGKAIIKFDDWDKLRTIIDNVLAHPTASTLLAIGHAEQSIYWVDDVSIDGHEPTYRLCRGRTDHMDLDAHNVIVDLKSAEDASYTGFMRACVRWGYGTQAAWYSHGVSRARGGKDVDGFIFIVFEKDPPFGIGLYELPDQMKMFGRTMMARAVTLYSECLKTDEWPCYDESIRVLEFPPWAYRADIT